MTKIIALIYWTFKTDNKQTTPYLSTCLFLGLIFILNIASLMVILKIPRSAFTMTLIDNEKFNSWLNTLITTSPILIGFYVIFPQKKLNKYSFNQGKIKNAKRKLLIYFFISLLLFVALLIQFGIERRIFLP